MMRANQSIADVEFLILVGTTVLLMPLLTLRSTLDPALTIRFLAWALVLLAVCLLFLARIITRPESIDCRVAKRALFVAVLGYFLLSVVSLTGAVNVTEGLYEVLKALLSGLFLLLATMILGRRRIYTQILAQAVVVSAMLQSLIGLYQHVRDGAIVRPGHFGPAGTMAHKNLYASALFLMLPFCMYVCLRGRRYWRVMSVTCVASALLLILLSATRAVWLALLVSTVSATVVLVVLVTRGKLEISAATARTLLRACGYVGILLVLIGAPSGILYTRSHSIENMVHAAVRTDSVAERLSVWRATVDLIRDHPLRGAGAGNWKIALPSHGLPKGFSPEWLKTKFFVRPHNDFLWAAAEIGIVGALFYLAMFAIAILYTLRTMASRSCGDDKLLALLMFFGIVGYMVISCASFPRERIFHSALLLMMMAVATSVYHRNVTLAEAGAGRAMLGLLLTAQFLLPLAVLIGYCRLTAEIHTKKALAAREARDWPAVIAEIDKGYSVLATLDPMSTPLQWYRGEAHFFRDNITQALADYRKARAAHPYHIHVLNNLATCCELTGRHAEAIRHYEEAIRIFPQFTEALANLVAVHVNAGQYERARELLLRCDPHTAGPTLERYGRIVTERLEGQTSAVVAGRPAGETSRTDTVATDVVSGTLKAVHQLWSSTHGRHFHTIDDVEKDAFLRRRDEAWVDEGIVYYAWSDASEPGSQPVHRFYSSRLNAYFYTVAPAEAKRLIDEHPQQWRYEGITYYAFPEGRQPPGTSPVHRFWSATLRYHLFTIDENEKDRLQTEHADVWTYEGIAWHAYAPPPPK